jgi:hypothetical protein
VTTNYLESRCPIVSRCIRQLKGMVATVSFDDEDDLLISLAQGLESASADPDIVRLRAFIGIEKLLKMLEWTYTRTYNAKAPELRQRSWAGLTTLKREIEGIVDKTILDSAEHTLAGVQVNTQNHVVVLPKRMMEAGLVDFTHQVTAVRRVYTLATAIDSSIGALRPYLRNEGASVGIIGEMLAQCHMELYGVLATTYLMQTTRELLDVKL